MGERTKYSPGTFSWTDLTTSDQPAAKQFYSQLFGWDAIDNPIGDDMVYSMMQMGGKDVAAISPQMQAQREAGVPPTWNSYVTVESADAAADRAQKLGATVLSPAFDVFDVGRMAIIQDPQGAVLEVWEPKQHIGASLVNVPGALTWNELASTDPDASAGFYRELFDWKVEPFEGIEGYLGIQTSDGRSNGGIRAATENEPSYWLVYFGAEDAEAGAAKASELGATTLVQMDIGVGKIAALQDPQGAVFALYAGHLDD
ncbi:MAG: VOC family protein [Solirubrobacteraceae bacterium]